MSPSSYRDVLPFPLELPEAIAKAASHKELESISHMGIGKELAVSSQQILQPTLWLSKDLKKGVNYMTHWQTVDLERVHTRVKVLNY